MYYDIAVKMSKTRLEALHAVLKTVQTQAQEKNMSDAEVLDLRLIEDMFPLVKQVQVATDNAKGAASRLAGKETPSFEDSETTFEELFTRIEKTIAYLDSLTPDDFADAANKKIEMVYFKDMHFTAEGYLLGYHVSNFHFHLITAYNICRAHGFELGKKDFMHSIPLIPNS